MRTVIPFSMLAFLASAAGTASASENNSNVFADESSVATDTFIVVAPNRHESADTAVAHYPITETNVSLGEVMVTGFTGASKLSKSPLSVSVVSHDQLTQTTSTNIIDAVAAQPGVSQVSTGSGISKPVIRGLGYNRVLVVDGGVRQEGQQWGDEHGVEVDANVVHSVEVIKGPASLMYGSDAMAGVLIFQHAPTLPAGQIAGNVGAEYQTNNGLAAYSLSFAGNCLGGLVWRTLYSGKFAHAYKNRHDGYVFGSAFHEQAVSQMLGVNKSWGHSHVTFSYYELRPGIVEGERDDDGRFLRSVLIDDEEDERPATHSELKSYDDMLPYQRVRHTKVTIDNSFAIADGALKLILAYQRNRRQEFEDLETPDEPSLDFLLHTVNYDVHFLSAIHSGWKWMVGVGGMYQKSLNKGFEFLIPAYHLFDYGIFATFSKEAGPVVINGGLRFDQRHLDSKSLIDDGEELFADFSRTFEGVAAGLGCAWRLGDRLNLKLNFSRGFRAPNISELSANGVHEGSLQYELGNRDLDPESSWQIDLGADYSSHIFSAQLALFANRINDYIFSSRVSRPDGQPLFAGDVPIYQFTAGDARLWGGEARIDVHCLHRLHIGSAFSYVNSVQLHQPEESKYLPLTPAPKVDSDVRYEFICNGRTFDDLFLRASVSVSLRQDHFYRLNDTETATPAYALLGLSAGTNIKHRGHRILTLLVSASNLADKAYQSHLSRLKYAPVNEATGRMGVFNMGRNFTFKVVVPISIAD